MRIILQRVKKAGVYVQNKLVNEIGQGLLVFVGVGQEDEEQDMEWILQKLLNLRIFQDDAGKMNLNIESVKGQFLIISQFTLYASTKKGNRPSFTQAAPPKMGETMYQLFIDRLRDKSNLVVKSGIFGADMQVSLQNDGPVTIILDSKNKY